MGLVVDLSQSAINVESDRSILDRLAPDMGPITNFVTCAMPSFEARFTFRFDPRLGYPPPNQTGSCQIGIVQNVLYTNMLVHYDDGRKVYLKEPHAALDCGDQNVFPFYNRPGGVSRKDSKGNVINAKNIFPYRDISYNSKGFGELLDPWKPDGDNLITQLSNYVSLVDQPFFKVRLRDGSGGLITELTHIITFGIWLVALPSDPTKHAHVFAHGDVFSLLYTCNFTTRGGPLLSIGVPDTAFRVSSKKGRATSAQEFKDGGPGLRVHPGAGNVQPVLKGVTAQVKDKKWEEQLLAI